MKPDPASLILKLYHTCWRDSRDKAALTGNRNSLCDWKTKAMGHKSPMVQMQVLLCEHRDLQQFLVSGKYHRHKNPNKPMKKPQNTWWRCYLSAWLLRICGSYHCIFLWQHKLGISACVFDSSHICVWMYWSRSLFSSWDQPKQRQDSFVSWDPSTGSSLPWFGCPHHLAMDHQVLPALARTPSAHSVSCTSSEMLKQWTVDKIKPGAILVLCMDV